MLKYLNEHMCNFYHYVLCLITQVINFSPLVFIFVLERHWTNSCHQFIKRSPLAPEHSCSISGIFNTAIQLSITFTLKMVPDWAIMIYVNVHVTTVKTRS